MGRPKCLKKKCIHWSIYTLRCLIDKDMEYKKDAGEIGKETYICLRNPDKKMKDYCKERKVD